jgi:predicted dehydrogenase
MDSSSRLRLALIGAGRRGAGAHLPVINVLTDVYELVGICDKDEATAKRYAMEHGVRGYTSVRELIERERPDVVDLVVPCDAHHAIALFLMQHGVNVLVETPIAPTLRLADLMIQGAKRHGVKLEVAENYYRAPLERLIALVIDAGLIGEVSRVYRIFHEGGYHGMSSIRLQARGKPVSVMGVSHRTPVVAHVDRMLRHHDEERWSMGIIDFDNGVMAVQIYSNVVHARSLGRGQLGLTQIDGAAGAIVSASSWRGSRPSFDEEVHLVPTETLQSGARSTPARPERETHTTNGVEVLDALYLPGTDVRWENPYNRYPLTERHVAVADELTSIARAVRDNVEPEYGAWQGRLDQEMNIAMLESGRHDRQTIRLPLTTPTAYEESIHAAYRDTYGCDADDVEQLVDVFFPRV